MRFRLNTHAIRPSRRLLTHRVPLRAPDVIHRKLHDMVDDPKRRDYVRWAKDGRSFVITDEEKFERNLAGVLPGLSFMMNMGNFHRELANYGFKKPDAHKLEFEHEGFVRGADDEELARVRQKENYGRYRKDASAAGKPPAIVRA